MRKESKWLLSCWFWSTGCMNQSGLDHTPWWKKRCVLSSPSYLSLLFFNRKEKKLVAASSKRHPATACSATRHQLIRLHSFGHRAAQTRAKASFRSIWRTVFAAGDLCPCRFIFILLHSMWSDNAFVDSVCLHSHTHSYPPISPLLTVLLNLPLLPLRLPLCSCPAWTKQHVNTSTCFLQGHQSLIWIFQPVMLLRKQNSCKDTEKQRECWPCG